MGKVWFLSGLVLVVFLVFMVVNMAQVWATVTFNPNPPVDGQPFTITSSGGPGTSLSVYGSCGCNGGCGITAGASPYTVTLAAGQYNVFDSGDSSCTSFTVVPAVTSTTTTVTTPIPEYPYGLALLAVFMVLGYAVVKRRTRN
ncbi:MAG: hypothetical protein ABSF63_11640 [Candidatus Bathyarchaeia archaeon]